MKRILVITNPAAARGGATRVLNKVKQLTTEHDDCCSFDFVMTERPGHATELTREKASAYDLVAAFGGDGTINEVANGLAGGNTPMGVIPNGTGNDFARSAGIPRNPRAAIELLCKGIPEPIDLGVANGRYFTNSVGIGFVGQANYESAQITRIKGSLVFILAVLKTMWSWKAAPMTVIVDGQTIVHPDDPTYLVGIGNGWSIGGGMKLNPDARLDS
ncbi:MAG: YegS/Rv2252/BmrU family lipid kinase, partial [Candidatus Neomarinimicrobiota bacterium]